jgi:hypothetical protein
MCKLHYKNRIPIPHFHSRYGSTQSASVRAPPASIGRIRGGPRQVERVPEQIQYYGRQTTVQCYPASIGAESRCGIEVGLCRERRLLILVKREKVRKVAIVQMNRF